VTAIPKVTPRMRSKLPVEGAGFGLAAVGSILRLNLQIPLRLIVLQRWRWRIPEKCVCKDQEK